MRKALFGGIFNVVYTLKKKCIFLLLLFLL